MTLEDNNLLDLVLWPDSLLSTVCDPVPDDAFGSDELTRQVADMIYTMYANKGIGLAANQVGFLNRVIIISKSPESPKGLPLVIINPKILSRGTKFQTLREGCLSFPGQQAIRRRNQRVSFEAKDLYGSVYNWQSRDLQAQCFAHELDHLNGKNFLER